MQALELLAPAKNLQIGIAAIDCGADAVYIAGPDFGARKAAGNSFEDIAALCEYAHRFGARVFVTFNTTFSDQEEEQVHTQMLQAQASGADAFIIRDERILAWEDLILPMHASTQCAIRSEQRAKYFEGLGCSRIVLERQLSLEQISNISKSVSCELECFVHGALCVCYSGDCRLSEFINGRSADKGDCMQACRSLYDLVDENGRTLVHNKALLSLKDLNLRSRIGELAQAGVCSFKIEGRLKNISYVRNVVRDYDLALNELIAKYPERYCRASFGRISGGFTPDTDKTFNRSYTELYFDAKRGSWSSKDAPKSMGEFVGVVDSMLPGAIRLKAASKDIILNNGDGFAFASGSEIVGFRANVCEGMTIYSSELNAARQLKGTKIFRNLDSAFEQVLSNQLCRREIGVRLKVKVAANLSLCIKAISEDGRQLEKHFCDYAEPAQNIERATSMLKEQLSKRSGHYYFILDSISYESSKAVLPFMSAATINSIRRLIASELDSLVCNKKALHNAKRTNYYENYPNICISPVINRELMRSKYCVRYELGLCPRYQGAKSCAKLYLVNNKRRFALHFDCTKCEMVLLAD